MDLLAHIDDEVIKRFITKVKKRSNGCYEWIGAVGDRGRYGTFSLAGKTVGAHRIAWIIANGEDIPDGQFVCHSCDNSLCVHPEHLFLGTHKENMKDMCHKGRSKKGQKKLTVQEVLEIRKLWSKGKNYQYINKKFNINGTTVQRIVTGKLWKNI